MTGLGIITQKTGLRALGWYGLADYLTDAPYACYLHGTGYPALERHDYSGNGRDLIIESGSVPNLDTDQVTGDGSSWYTAPFSAADVLADTELGVAGEMTMVSVCVAPAEEDEYRVCLVGNYDSTAEPCCMLSIHENTSNTYRFYANPGDGEAGIYARLPRTASTGEVWEMVAGVWTPTTVQGFRRLKSTIGGGGVANSDVVALSTPPDGTRALRIGRDYGSGGFNDPVAVAMTLILSQALTVQKITDLYAELQAFFADKMPGIDL